MKKIKKWEKIKHKIGNRIENNLLFISILTPIILIVIRKLLLVFWSECYNPLRDWIGLDFYQIILMAGAVIGLLWTNKRYKQGQENLKQSEKSLKQSEEIAFKNKMNTQYLEVIKAISDEKKKKTPIVVNLINAIQVSIAIFYDTEEKKKKEKKKKARKEILNFRGMNLTAVHLIRANLKGANLTWADLKGVHLIGADLKGANLTDTDLTGANLTGANLTEVDLKRADFNISSLNALSLNQLDSAKNVTEITIYIHSKKKPYFLKEFVEMNPTNSITDKGFQLKGEIFDYLVELSKKN